MVGLIQGWALPGKQIEGEEGWVSALLPIPPDKLYLPSSEELIIIISTNTECQNEASFFPLTSGQILSAFF